MFSLKTTEFASQLQTHIIKTQHSMNQHNVEHTLETLYAFGALLRTYYPAATPAQVANQLEKCNMELTNKNFTLSQFSTDLGAAILDFRPMHGAELEKDPLLNCLSWNITTGLNGFYTLITIPDENLIHRMMPDEYKITAYDAEILSFINEKKRGEKKQIEHLVTHMKIFRQELSLLQKKSKTKAVKKILADLSNEIEKVNKKYHGIANYPDCLQVKSEYSTILQEAEHQFSTIVDLGKNDVDLVSRLRNQIIRAIDSLKPVCTNKQKIRTLFYNKFCSFKDRLVRDEAVAKEKISAYHQDICAKIDCTKKQIVH